MNKSANSARTFSCPEVLTSVLPSRTHGFIIRALSRLEGPHGSGHPDPDFEILVSPQHNQLPCNRSTRRKNTPCHGVHDNSR
jgi:hypothetical protein